MSYDLTVKDAYRRMAYIRAFEEQVLELGREGQVIGSVHLALSGQRLGGLRLLH